MRGAAIACASVLLGACASNNYYDESIAGTGVFAGGSGYRLLDPPQVYQPYQRPAVQNATDISAGRSEIRIFTPRSYRGDLAALTTACAKRIGVSGPVKINTGTLKNEKFAALLPTANVSNDQQERTAKCVTDSIK